MNKKWYEIYEKNKYLDTIFDQKYSNTEDYFKKNCIEFLVELGEFVNETKCFKYWSVKKPKMDEVLEEFADSITMLLFFFNKSNLDLENLPKHIDNNNKLDVINYIYLLGTDLILNYNSDLLKSILSNLIYLGNLFELNEDDIINAIKNKHKVIEERLNSEY